MKLRTVSIAILSLATVVLLLVPEPANAIPAFARKYGVKCYTCHTIPPALNKNGYMFKRLGYRMPPDGMDGSKPAPKVIALDKDIKFSITNSLAFLTHTSFTGGKSIADNGDGTSTEETSSGFNLDEVMLMATSTIPDTGFSYGAHYMLFGEGGMSGLEQAFGVYTAGRANNSFFVKGGAMHIQEGEGTRAAMLYNLFDEPSFTIVNTDPLNFSLDQAPAGIDVGYTWASNYFERVFAISAKVTNGVNADGEEVVQDSSRKGKDVWVDADYWFGPDGGVTVMMYRGRKDQIQNEGTADEFTYQPAIWRTGVFGNYLFFDKLDILGNYMHGNDDWQTVQNGPTSKYIQDGYRGEVDYYLKTGTALMARVSRMNQHVGSQPVVHSLAWGIGAEHAFTPLGNVIGRAAYTQEHDVDPVELVGSTDKRFKVDFRFMW